MADFSPESQTSAYGTLPVDQTPVETKNNSSFFLKTAAVAAALAVFCAFVIWKFAPFLAPVPEPAKDETITLTVWTTREDEAIFRYLGQEYQKSHPNIKIQYENQRILNYRTRVQTQIANNQGPDIFMIHSSWVPTFLLTDSLYSAPTNIMKFNDFTKQYYPIVKDTLTYKGKIYALPWEIDGLALFYNEDILRAAAQKVPTTWGQFQQSALAMTVKDEGGTIKTAGAALGAPLSVDHWQDILGLLFYQQPGASLSQPGSKEASEIVKFFISFTNPTDPAQKVWDSSLGSSTKAFADGKLAFYLGPSYRVREFASNPELKFQTAPVPQLPDGNIGWGSFWSLAVSNTSAHPDEAWEFLEFISSPDNQKNIFDLASQTRIFGEPYARVDMKDELKDDPWLGAFITQAPTYRTWYLASKTEDQGINDELSREFEAVIQGSLAGNEPLNLLQSSAPRIQAIIDKYTKPQTPVQE